MKTTEFLNLKKPESNDYYNIEDQNDNADIIDATFEEVDSQIRSNTVRLSNIESSTYSETVTTREAVTEFPSNTHSGGTVEIEKLYGLTLIQQQSDDFNHMWTSNMNADASQNFGKNPVGFIDNTGGTIEKYAFSKNQSKVSDGDYIFMGVFAKCESGTADIQIVSIAHDSTDTWKHAPTLSFEGITSTWAFYGGIKQHSGSTLEYAKQRLDVESYGTGNDKVYFSRPYYINLTALGLEDLTHSQLVHMVHASEYWAGIRSVENIRIQSRAENLFNKDTSTNFHLYNQISHAVRSVETKHCLSNPICVEGGVTYYLPDGFYFLTNEDWAHIIVDFDGNVIEEVTTLPYGQSVTIPDSCHGRLMRFNICYIGCEYENIAIQKNSAPAEGSLECDFFESDIIGTFRALPNGTQDILKSGVIDDSFKHWKIKHIDSFSTAGQSGFISELKTGTNIQRVTIPLNNMPGIVTQTSGVIDKSTAIDHFIESIDETGSWDVSANAYGYATDAENLYLYMPLETYSSISDAEKNLSIEMLYQLESPVEEISNAQICSPITFADGELVVLSETGLMPKVLFKTPINQGAVITDISERVSEHQSFIEQMTGVEVPPKIMTQENATVSLEINNGGVEPILRGSGQMITNSVYNGDFEYGTDGWDGIRSTNTVSGEILINTSDGSDKNPYIAKSNLMNGFTGKVFVYCRARANIDAKRIMLYLSNEGANTAHFVTKSTDLDSYQDVYGLFNVTSEINLGINIYHQYDSASDASEKTLNIDGNAGIFAINMTELGIEDYTEEQMLCLVKQGYIKGSQSLSDLAIEIRGENLADNYRESLRMVNGVESTTDNRYFMTDYISVGEAKSATFSMVDFSDQDWSCVHCFDQGKNFLESLATVAGEQTYFFHEDTAFIRHSIRYTSDNIPSVDILMNERKPILVLEGVASIEYREPYRSIAYLKGNEHFTANDTFEIKNGKAVVEREWSNVVDIDSGFGLVECSEHNDGYKTLRFSTEKLPSVNGSETRKGHLTKFNGFYCDWGKIADGPDRFNFSDGYLYVTINNSDSGWADSYKPTSKEIRAYFNGWVMYNSGTQMPYEDGGTKKWAKRYQGIGTSYELSMGVLIETGTERETMPLVKAYEELTKCYKLQYKLKAPQTYEVDLWGVPTLPEGQCYLTMRNGTRLEQASPVLLETTSTYWINNTAVTGSELEKTAKRIEKVLYMDGDNTEDITSYWTENSVTTSFGDVALSCISSDFIKEWKNNIYVVYETLNKDNNAGVFNAKLTYTDDAQSVVEQQGELISYLDEQLAQAQSEIELMTTEGDKSHKHFSLKAIDDRDIKPNKLISKQDISAYFTSMGGLTSDERNNAYQDMLVLNTWCDYTGGNINALVFDKKSMKIMHFQAKYGAETWENQETLAYKSSVDAMSEKIAALEAQVAELIAKQ